MHYFIVLVIISVCVKCFNIDVRIYGTLLFFFHPGFFVILILMYAFIVLVLFVVVVDCQADFDVDNVQRRELVNFYGV